ncbi:DUF2284 domain-containing protein [Hippea jasoniae]|uniref:DUF2284 domain-containing protein n=1 Tax=Hippea jasoniae TaxID=944479 RepID=UPI00054F5959|nr:DUF2284 domain-containing protein [Hippea jasoniae]
MKLIFEKTIVASNIVVSPRPVWKCFSCSNYSKRAGCPPFAPDYTQTKELLKHYHKAILFKFEIDMNDFENEKRKILFFLLKKEKEFFKHSYIYALALFPGSCNICSDCNFETNGICTKREFLRPSIDAIGIELSSITEINFKEPVLYGILLVE